MKFNIATPSDTVVYVFEGLEQYGKDGQAPSLITKSSTERNFPYWEQFIARAQKKRPRRRAVIKVDARTLQDAREEDYSLFARLVSVDFDNPALTSEGVPATKADIEDFLRAIPIHLFDEYRAYCGDDLNFMPDSEFCLDTEEVEDLKGN